MFKKRLCVLSFKLYKNWSTVCEFMIQWGPFLVEKWKLLALYVDENKLQKRIGLRQFTEPNKAPLA